MANLFLDVLRKYVAAGRFRIHDFVVMRNHFHLLLSVYGETTVEKAIQLIKGNFSYRAKKELDIDGRSGSVGFQRCVYMTGKAFSITGNISMKIPSKQDTR
jgi:REP-associated tyrosine transposase